MHQHSFSQGLSSFFSASCAPSLGGCSPLSRTPPAGPPIISASNGPGLPAVPRRPAQSSGLPQRHPVSLAGGVVAPYAPRPLRSLPPRNGGVSVPLWRWRSRGTGQPLRPSGLRLSALHRSATGCVHGSACTLLPVPWKPGPSVPVALPWSVVSSIRYFLAGTTPLLGYNSPMPAEYTSCASIQ